MNKNNYLKVLFIILIILFPRMLSAKDLKEGVPLQKFQDFPVLEKSLVEKSAKLDPSDSIRVIIYLRYPCVHRHTVIK